MQSPALNTNITLPFGTPTVMNMLLASFDNPAPAPNPMPQPIPNPVPTPELPPTPMPIPPMVPPTA